ncbi:MAG: hypothetical protein KGV59_04195 [Tenacibaculum sp.]|nr:hypothetical protein [Tenacibaculum sp.]
MDTKRQQLIEQTVELYKQIGYSPIAGRIMGLLNVSEQKYFTFEQLMETLQISKSATSKALKFLLEINEIDFIIKPENTRRRYFYISGKGSVKSMEVWSNSLLLRKQILEKILQVRSDKNQEINDFIKQMIAFIDDVYPFITDKIQEHFVENKLENNNQNK